MSDIPRTDSEISRIKKATKSMENASAYFENYQCMRDFARELECELAAMTAERDALKLDEQVACDMARAMIKNCRYFRTLCADSGCRSCSDWSNKSCAGRKWLEAHHQPDAWKTQS